MSDWQERTRMLFGEDALRALSVARVAVIGVGGVGAYAAEMIVRAGVGHIVLVDSDSVGESNINRQLLALHSTIGNSKVEVLKSRMLDINPSVEVLSINDYLNEENVSSVLGTAAPDFVIDAIDTLSPKIALIQHCLKKSIPIVSSMGSGAKLDVTKVRIADISRTRMCPLAHMLRKRLHKLGINSGFLAVYSEETPVRESTVLEESRNKKSQVGSVSYLPAVFGCACAQAVICGIAGIDGIC